MSFILDFGIWLLEHIMIFRFKLRHKCLFQIRTGSTKCSASRQCLYKVQCTSQHNKISVPCSLFSVDFIMALCILANNIVKCTVSTLLSLLGHISILWKSYFHNLFHSQSESKVWQNLSNVASQQYYIILVISGFVSCWQLTLVKKRSGPCCPRLCYYLNHFKALCSVLLV